MLICAEIGSDVHALTKGIAIRRVEHRSEILSNESQHLAKGTEVAPTHTLRPLKTDES